MAQQAPQESTVSNNKLHIPLVLVIGFILSCQIGMAVYFFGQLTSVQTSTTERYTKMQNDFVEYKGSIDLRVSLAEQSLKVTLESLQDMKSDLKAIRSALQEHK